jgi:hypothetical protein
VFGERNFFENVNLWIGKSAYWLFFGPWGLWGSGVLAKGG